MKYLLIVSGIVVFWLLTRKKAKGVSVPMNINPASPILTDIPVEWYARPQRALVSRGFTYYY